MILEFGERLMPVEKEEWLLERKPAVFLANSKKARETLKLAGIVYDGEIQTAKVGFCKLETQQECLAGSFCIPKLLDVLGSRYQILFFVNQSNIVLLDDTDFSIRLIRRIQIRKNHQGECKERFIYNYITEFMSRDLELLGQYEQKLLDMEEDVIQGKLTNFQNELMPIRRELLVLRSYYDEIMDMGTELEDNENYFFRKKRLKYFGIITNRADRLRGKTVHLLEYAQQVRDSYQAVIDAKQNSNMQFLTVISTIFFPLTLITGWYGMNFKDMPELDNGYPGVVILSVVVILVCILIFKKKNIF